MARRERAKCGPAQGLVGAFGALVALGGFAIVLVLTFYHNTDGRWGQTPVLAYTWMYQAAIALTVAGGLAAAQAGGNSAAAIFGVAGAAAFCCVCAAFALQFVLRWLECGDTSICIVDSVPATTVWYNYARFNMYAALSYAEFAGSAVVLLLSIVAGAVSCR